MVLKVIQVNIFKGMYLESLIKFLKAEDADIVTMQEVARGVVSNHKDKDMDLFDHLKTSLGLNGVFHSDVKIAGHPDALHGNAVFTKFEILESDQIVLKSREPITITQFNDPATFPDFPRSIVDASVDIDGQLIHVMSLHGAWTAPPTDTPETLRQAHEIAAHLESIETPFILGGDLNTTPDREVIKIIEGSASNLITGSDIYYTTHPTNHKIAPRKLLVDYIFASDEFKKLSITAPEVLVSDHLPVVAELEFT